MAAEKKKVGIIGFGEMGKRLCHELISVTSGIVEIVSAVEPSDSKFQEGCTFIKSSPERYATIKNMLESTDLDGVIIASPNNIHYENLQELENLDIPLLLEKPLDADFAKICDVLRFSKKYTGPIMVDHVMRYSPILLKAKELLDLGTIGKICSFNFVQNCHYGNGMYRCFRRTMAGGGGMFLEKATHDFDILLSFLGVKPVKVTAVSRRQVFGGDKSNDLRCSNCKERFVCKESIGNVSYRRGADFLSDGLSGNDLCVYAKETNVPDNETCLVEFDNGVFGTYSQCFFSPASYTGREYEVIGDLGIMRISLTHHRDHNNGRILVCPRFGTPGDSLEFTFDYRNRIHYNGGGRVAEHFYNLMDAKAKPFTTVDQAFAAEMLGYAATISASDGKSLTIADLLPDEDMKKIWSSDWEKTYAIKL